MGKNQLERILQIDRIIRDRGGCTKKELTERFEVSEKSIERDFAYMKDRLMAPLEYDRHKELYVYTDSSYFLPSVSMTEGQILALSLSSEILNHFNAVGEFGQLKESFDRLAAYLPDEVQVDLSRINNRVTVITDQQSPLSDKVWHVLTECLRGNRLIKLQYRKPDNREYESKTLEPYSLVAFRGNWYLIAHSPEKGTIRTYALSRMKDPIKEKGTFTIPKDFKLEDYIDPEWGIYARKESYDFKLKFSPGVANIIKEKRWHKTQQTEEQADGSLILSFQSGQIETIGQWVMSWGAEVTVISPSALEKQVKDNIGSLGDLYRINNDRDLIQSFA